MKTVVAAGLGLAVAGSVLASASVGNASTRFGMAITGSVVGGVVSGEPGQEEGFVFTLKNRSRTTARNAVIHLSWTGGLDDTTGKTRITCVAPDHHAFNPDWPNCEPGDLRAGRSTQAIFFDVQTAHPMRVTACIGEGGYSDAVKSNNCKTLSVG